MNSGEDEQSSFGLNGRLRPRKPNGSSQPSLKANRRTEDKTALDKPKRTNTPSKALPNKLDDLANKSDFSLTPQILCPYCEKKFSSKQTLSKHSRRIHFASLKQDGFLKCMHCNHVESDANNVIKHMVDSHPNQYFACLDCHTRFPSTTELAEHKLNVCEKQKPPYRNKLRRKRSVIRKKRKSIEKGVIQRIDREYQDGHGFNGIVISCELKPSRVNEGADIEDNITTNLILPPNKTLVKNTSLDKNAVIVLDDIQWNKRMPANFAFHNTDADQILSRLGVVHRSPRTGESNRRDWFKSIDESTQKFEKCFDTSFYSKVASNVQENLTKFLDGSFNFNPDPDNIIKTRKAKNSVVINTAEGFPILLACEQYSRNVFEGYNMPRAIAPKHKWKRDNLDIDKSVVNPDQIKRDSHTNNCIITLVSSLDIWTQLCMRNKFEDKFSSVPIEKKTEKQNIISKELKEILESREIPTTSSNFVKNSHKHVAVTKQDFPTILGLIPSTPVYKFQPAVLSGEWVRPRCYVCCACGVQTYDGRELTSHKANHHPNAQVQHYEIAGELLRNADILKHLYVPPSQTCNRTRPPRGIRECTKCKKSVSLEDLHQHMLDCAGDTPAVRRKCRNRPFGVRKRRTRLPDNAMTKKIRKHLRNRRARQKNHVRPRPRIRTEVGDAETIRKMLADLPAKRHRVMVNPLNLMPGSRKKLEKQRSKLLMKRHSSESAVVRKNPNDVKSTSNDDFPNSDGINKSKNVNINLKNKLLKPKLKRVVSKGKHQRETLKRKMSRPIRNTARLKRQINLQVNNQNEPRVEDLPVRENNDQLANENLPQRINLQGEPYNGRQNADGNEPNNREGHEQPGNGEQNRNDQNIPLEANNVPLKHSIASLTADSETHDKSVQFHQLFLVQQECNNVDEHAASAEQIMFENEDVAIKLDKPPLDPTENQVEEKQACSNSDTQKASVDPQLAQKSKLNKPRKGLNDCIAMLRNKLVDPVPSTSGHVSVQCGSDEPLYPLPIVSQEIKQNKDTAASNTSSLRVKSLNLKTHTDLRNEEMGSDTKKRSKSGNKKSNIEQESSKHVAQKEHLSNMDNIEKNKKKTKVANTARELKKSIVVTQESISHTQEIINVTQACSRPALVAQKSITQESVFVTHQAIHATSESVSGESLISHKSDCDRQKRILAICDANASRKSTSVTQENVTITGCSLPSTRESVNVVNESATFKHVSAAISKEMIHDSQEAAGSNIARLGQKKTADLANPIATRSPIDSLKNMEIEKIKDETNRSKVENDSLVHLSQAELNKNIEQNVCSKTIKSAKDRRLDTITVKNSIFPTQSMETNIQKITSKQQRNLHTENLLKSSNSSDMRIEQNSFQIHREEAHDEPQNQNIPSNHSDPTLAESIAPLDLSGKTHDIKQAQDKNDTINVCDYDCLDLSNKKINTSLRVDDVVDLRISTIQKKQGAANVINNPEVINENVTDLSIKTCLQNIPTDLSIKTKVNVMFTNFSRNVKNPSYLHELRSEKNEQRFVERTVNISKKLNVSDDLVKDLSGKGIEIASASNKFTSGTELNVSNDSNNDVADLGIVQPTDLSGKVRMCVQKKSGVVTPTLTIVQSDQSPDTSVNSFQNQEKTIPNMQINENSSKIQKPFYDPTLRIPQYKITSAATSLTERRSDFNVMAPTSIISSTTLEAKDVNYPLANKSFSDKVTSSENTFYNVNNIVVTTFGIAADYTLTNRTTTTTFGKIDNTKPVYTLSNACITVTKINNTGSTVLTNTLLSIPGTTIASTTSVYTLAGSSSGAPINYGTIASPSCHIVSDNFAHTSIPSLQSNANLENFNVNIQPSVETSKFKATANSKPKESKGKEHERNKEVSYDNIQDSEIAKKIAMLPKELVEILGTMPLDHRNQLLNVLPQYVSAIPASVNSAVHTEKRFDLPPKKALSGTLTDDINDKRLINSECVETTNKRTITKPSHNLVSLQPSGGTDLERVEENTVPSHLISSLLPIYKSKSVNDVPRSTISTDINYESGQNTRRYAEESPERCRRDQNNDVIDLTVDEINPNEDVKEEMPYTEPIQISASPEVFTPKQQKSNNERTASLRAVRIRNASERHKLNLVRTHFLDKNHVEQDNLANLPEQDPTTTIEEHNKLTYKEDESEIVRKHVKQTILKEQDQFDKQSNNKINNIVVIQKEECKSTYSDTNTSDKSSDFVEIISDENESKVKFAKNNTEDVTSSEKLKLKHENDANTFGNLEHSSGLIVQSVENNQSSCKTEFVEIPHPPDVVDAKVCNLPTIASQHQDDADSIICVATDDSNDIVQDNAMQDIEILSSENSSAKQVSDNKISNDLQNTIIFQEDDSDDDVTLDLIVKQKQNNQNISESVDKNKSLNKRLLSKKRNKESRKMTKKDNSRKIVKRSGPVTNKESYRNKFCVSSKGAGRNIKTNKVEISLEKVNFHQKVEKSRRVRRKAVSEKNSQCRKMLVNKQRNDNISLEKDGFLDEVSTKSRDTNFTKKHSSTHSILESRDSIVKSKKNIRAQQDDYISKQNSLIRDEMENEVKRVELHETVSLQKGENNSITQTNFAINPHMEPPLNKYKKDPGDCIEIKTSNESSNEHEIDSLKLTKSQTEEQTRECDAENIDIKKNKSVRVKKVKSVKNMEETSTKPIDVEPEDDASPLRRSRRVKSLFAEGLPEHPDEPEILSIIHKTPLTKKQLIFSKMLHDEDNSVKSVNCNTKETKLTIVKENYTNVKQVPNTFVSHNKEVDLHDSQIEKNKSSKRKKSLLVKRNPKKKRTEISQNLNEQHENAKEKSQLVDPILCNPKEKQSHPEEKTNFVDNPKSVNSSHFNVIFENSTEVNNKGNEIVKTTNTTDIHKVKKSFVDLSSKSDISKIMSKDNTGTITEEAKEERSKKDTIHKNKRDICTKYPSSETRMTCYNKPVAVKRTRSKSSALKLSDEDTFDPYDIDLDETIETTKFYGKKRHISEKSSNSHKPKSIETTEIKKITKTHSSVIEANKLSELQKEKVLNLANETIKDSKDNENDSDESSKSDVPLNKYVKETGKSETKNSNVVKSNDRNKSFDLEQSGHSVESSIDAGGINVQGEVEDQLRSDQFMESFGFFSERKPRKSNLLASKKISETFHIIANESDELCFHNKEKTGPSESSATEVVFINKATSDEKCDAKSDGDMDSLTAKSILESEEVRNLENDLISGLKEAAHASSLNKSNIDCQYVKTDTTIGVPEEIPINYSSPNRTESNFDHIEDFEDAEQNPSKPKKTEQKLIGAKNRLVSETMENIEIFEDKFDKIKRKCRSQAAAAKQTQTIVEQQNSRKSRKKADKKAKKGKKNHHSTVLTKGALKGFDGPTSTSMGTATAIEIPTKKKKKNGPKKKIDRKEMELSKNNSQNLNKECPQLQRKVDVYEFMDDELFEFRPSTLMERFKSINNKETSSMKLIHASNEVENSNISASDGDDFVYMSDDYVCSDDETENSLMSFDMGIRLGADNKKTSPLKRKDVIEKNAVMGKIFKNNAVRSEKKSNKTKEPEKPKANLDQLFDSLLEDEKNSSIVCDDTSKKNHYNTSTSSHETSKKIHEKKNEEDFVSTRKHDTSTSNKYESFGSSSLKKCSLSSLNIRGTKKHESLSKKLDGNETSNNRHYAIDSFQGPSTSKSFKVASTKDLTTSAPKKNEIARKYDIDKFHDLCNSELLNDEEELSMDKFGVKTKSKDKSPLEKLNKGMNSCIANDNSEDLFNAPLLLDEAGVARQRARRKCAVGKQNVLAETWSSESEAEVAPPRPKSALAVMVSTRKKRGRKKEGLLAGGKRNKNIESRVTSSIHSLSSCACVSVSGNSEGRLNISGDREGRLSVSGNKEVRLSGGAIEIRADSGKVEDGERIEYKEGEFSNPGPVTSKVRPRPSTYYWSSEGDDEQEHFEQHGWIVGDSHKKLVTMLAHAKGRKRNNDDKRHLVE